MNEKEVIKTHITTLQALMIAFLGAIFGVFGYVIIHIDEGFSKMQTILGVPSCAFLIVGFAWTGFLYVKFTKKLKRM